MGTDTDLAIVTDFEGLPAPAGVIGEDGTILRVNRSGATLMGRPTAETVGRKAWAFAPGIEHVWPELVRAAAAKGVHTGRLTIATPRGAREIAYMMVVREVGGSKYVVAQAVDTTADPV